MQNNRLERKETAFRLFSLTRCKRSVSDRAARLDAQAHTVHTHTHARGCTQTQHKQTEK